MATARDLRPGEARILQVRHGVRFLVHRPGARPIYLVYEENRRRDSVEALGSFTNWTAALGAIRARQGPPAATAG